MCQGELYHRYSYKEFGSELRIHLQKMLLCISRKVHQGWIPEGNHELESQIDQAIGSSQEVTV